jgi:hypothetical protein
VSLTSVRLSQAAVQQLARTDPDVLHDLDRRATLVQAAARQRVGKRTRKLERSIVKRPGADATSAYVDVVAEQPYARDHHDGTGPHLITPRNRKVLRFPTGTGTVFAYRVRHPGTAPNRFLTDVLFIAGR